MPPSSVETKKKRRSSCGCFSSPMKGENAEKDPYFLMDKNSTESVKILNANPAPNKDTAEEQSDAGSFFTLDDDELGGWVPGTKFNPDTSFRMGDSVPHNQGNNEGSSWSQSCSELFNVRTGPDYPKNGLKLPSLSALYEPFGVDILRGDKILSNLAPHLMFPAQPEYYNAECRLPAVLIINSQLPLAMPSLFSASESDAGWSCVGYFRVKKEAVEWALGTSSSTSPAPPAMNVYIRLLQKRYSEKCLALKAIGMIHELEKQDLPMMSLLTKYNGKPVLVTKSSEFHYGTSPYPYLEIDYNVRKWSLLARTTLVQLADKLKSMTCQIGYLVEATENDDLPERMLAIVTVHNLSVESAKWVHFKDDSVQTATTNNI